jgi:hypothetical protein
MKRSISMVLLCLASCATVPEPPPVVTTAITKQLPGPWTVVDGGASFFKAEAVLFSGDGRIRITREGKLRRGTWTMVDGMLEVKGVEQTTRFEVTPTTDGLMLRPLVEREGAWRRTDAQVTLRGARILPTAG